MRNYARRQGIRYESSLWMMEIHKFSYVDSLVRIRTNVPMKNEDDWAGRIVDLYNAGIGCLEIARRLGITTPTVVSNIRNGRAKSPTGMTAVRLYLLHEEICGRKK